jgi:hypothetical protein
MHRALVRLRLPDGTVADLGHGDLIGRVWTAALVMDDPRVSEAHAMVSLRGGELWLLSLRRRIAMEGRSLSEVRLEEGQRIELADRLELRVESVQLPAEVLAIEAPGLPRTVLPAVCSLRVRPKLLLSPRYEPDAPCRIWTTGDGWRIEKEGKVQPLEPGQEWVLEGLRFRSLAMPLGGTAATRLSGGVEPNLRIVAAFDTVQVHRGNEPPLVLGGVMARVLSELVTIGGPVSWEVVAREIWPDEPDTWALRKRWDVTLVRLRARLREARVRTDLVHADGTGQFELLLRDGDRVEDKT